MKPIRRKDREMDTERAKDLLARCDYGVLSTVDGDGLPYGVPLNYAFHDNAIYFHCAKTGHKLDNLKNNPRVSFCVVGKAEIIPDKFSTHFESVVVFGNASEVFEEERNEALLLLIQKYSSEFLDEGKLYIAKHDKATRVIRIEIDHISGKASR